MMIGICSICKRLGSVGAHHYKQGRTVVVCQSCHQKIHWGKLGVPALDIPAVNAHRKETKNVGKPKSSKSNKPYCYVQVTPAMVEIAEGAGYLGIDDLARTAIREKILRDYPDIYDKHRGVKAR